jgi:hypothetical protein
MTSRHIAKGRGVRQVGSARGKPLTVARKSKASKKKKKPPTAAGKADAPKEALAAAGKANAPKKPRVTFKARREQYLDAKRRGLNHSDAGQVLMDSGARLGTVLRVKKACGDAR